MSARNLAFIEVVSVNALHLIYGADGYPHAMVKHELGKHGAINEGWATGPSRPLADVPNSNGMDESCVVSGILVEATGGWLSLRDLDHMCELRLK